MNPSYLMVIEWTDGGRSDSKTRFDLIKQVYVQGKKATALGVEYEKELNGGREHTDDFLIECIKTNKTYFTVCSQPYNQCREYYNFYDWQECEEYKINGGN